MKRTAKKIARRLAPTLARDHQLIQEVTQKINDIETYIKAQEKHDNRLDKLKTLIASIEHYQPTYNIAGIIDQPMRSSFDRCEAIEDAIGPVRGLRILDLGSSLGYVSYYMADRGAVVEGWESNIQNAEASRLIGEINGVSVDIKTKEFNKETVRTISNGTHDVAVLLSVAHHIIRFNGLEYTQNLIRDLMDRVPTLVVELARKGEDPNLPWDASQPNDELAIFELVKKDVTLKKIGDFGNHLSSKKRPLYIVKKRQQLRINGKNYTYDSKHSTAYKNSPLARYPIRRRYYFDENHIIKEYYVKSGEALSDNIVQILNEIQLLTKLQEHHIFHLPRLVDFEVSDNKAYVVLQRQEGDLLSNIFRRLTNVQIKSIFKDVVRTLVDLHALNINHNDVRTWNVVVSSDLKHGYLIDYGLAGPIAEDDDVLACAQLIIDLENGVSARNHRQRNRREAAKMLDDNWKQLKVILNTEGSTINDLWQAIGIGKK